MKILHLSDPHINSDILYKIDAQSRFKLALKHIINNHSDADILIITGDLTHYGNDESYKIFIKILEELELPDHLYPKLILGNHDNRENFKKNFPDIKTDQNGFVQYYENFGNKTFIFLDTNLAGTDEGHLCAQRQEWLINSLKRHKDDAKEVKEGLECGIGIVGVKKFQEGDIIEVYEIEKKKRKLILN